MTEQQVIELRKRVRRFYVRQERLETLKLAGFFAMAIALGFFLAK